VARPVNLLDLDEEAPNPTGLFRPIVYLGRNFVRLIVRRVNEVALADETAKDALAEGQWKARVAHGGSTAKAYRHKADTEAALAVANPAGLVVVWMAKLPASNVTKSGAANACLPGTRALFDPRYGETSREDAWKLLRKEHRLHHPKNAYERLLGDEDF
jgi:hypothetical protein